MKQLIEIKNSGSKTLKIQYELSNICNYKCWSCFPGCNDGDSPWPELDIVKKNLSRIIEFYFENGIDSIQLNYLGGEPTLWKHLGELTQYLCENTKFDRKKKKLNITVQTNGSRTVRWWKEYGHYFSMVSISVHHERVDLDHVQKVAEILLDKNVLVITTVLMDRNAWDKCQSMINKLTSTKKKFTVMAKPINIDGVVDYDEEQLKYLKTTRKRLPSLKHIIKYLIEFAMLPTYTAIFDDGTKEKTRTDQYFILRKLNKFLGWKCTIGINWISINRKGEITGTCKAKLYGIDNYFNINDPDLPEKFNPVLQPVICERNICSCAGEAVLTKWKEAPKKIIPIYEN